MTVVPFGRPAVHYIEFYAGDDCISGARLAFMFKHGSCTEVIDALINGEPVGQVAALILFDAIRAGADPRENDAEATDTDPAAAAE